MPRVLLLAAAVCFGSSGPLAFGKHVEGTVSLSPYQATVVTKFCFDYSKDCAALGCPSNQTPGALDIQLYAAHRADGQPTLSKPTPEVFLALLDDEYFSFPEVSQVWDEANCTEVKRAAKRTYPVDWIGATQLAGFSMSTNVVEHVRPRWWYLVLVSCSPLGVDLSCHAHMQNLLQRTQSEMSMDAVGVGWAALLLFFLFSWIGMMQFSSAQQWASVGAPNGEGDGQSKRGRSRRICKLHPAVLLLTLAALLSAAGEGALVLHYWDVQAGTSLREPWLAAGRALRTVAKTSLSVLLMLLARGQCVCTPDISWDENRELVCGLVLFGWLSFGLETWGDSELRSTTTEYIYDTRPGMALVAFELLWLWIYVSRGFATWQAETRIKPRTFYRVYGLPMALWFASLPMISLLAAQIAPWVRFKVTFVLDGLVHALALVVLVHTFRPHVASGLYELSSHEYQSVQHEELDQVIRDDDFI